MGETPKLPERWDFAMDFLGNPEAEEVQAYVDALRAALTEKDREIEALNGTIAKYAADDVRYLETLAEKDREIERLRCPETNEEWRILAEDHKRLLGEISASQAREREAVTEAEELRASLQAAIQKAEKAEERASRRFREYVDLANTIAEGNDALAALRRAPSFSSSAFLARLSEAMEQRPVGNGFDRDDWLDEFRAALNGDSHAE